MWAVVPSMDAGLVPRFWAYFLSAGTSGKPRSHCCGSDSLSHRGKQETLSHGPIDKLMRHKTVSTRPVHNPRHKHELRSLIRPFFYPPHHIAQMFPCRCLYRRHTVPLTCFGDSRFSVDEQELKTLMRPPHPAPRNTFHVWAVMKIFPLGTGELEDLQWKQVRQQIKSKMKYANVIIFIRECLWQKAINFPPPPPPPRLDTLTHASPARRDR